MAAFPRVDDLALLSRPFGPAGRDAVLLAAKQAAGVAPEPPIRGRLLALARAPLVPAEACRSIIAARLTRVPQDSHRLD